MTAVDVLLGTLGLAALGAGLMVVTTRHIVRAGLWLVVSLGALAGMYLVLAAEMVAWVQVLIYVGAVVVLLLFAVMLTRAPIGPSENLDRVRWPAVLVGLGSGGSLAVLLVHAYRDVFVDVSRLDTAGPELMGQVLFSRWVLPFEVLSVLLLAALIGAIVMSRRTSGGEG
ncbi:MAG TPA: NADH-quinone oxidoreductase subunit J [Mycobacteriales bacterium]|nr:NADH-quinone oxidoreductase subunit J [Mycobacteriales bacterium]